LGKQFYFINILISFLFFVSWFPILEAIVKEVLAREKGTNKTGEEIHLTPGLPTRELILQETNPTTPKFLAHSLPVQVHFCLHLAYSHEGLDLLDCCPPPPDFCFPKPLDSGGLSNFEETEGATFPR
jgi:hypothetical protein